MIDKDDHKKNKRNLTAICTSEFSVVVRFNEVAFNILFKEKLKRDFDILASFVYKNVPGMNKFYTIQRVMSRAP